MNDKRCVICGEGLDSEEPNACYAPNPLSMRMAWMHKDCGKAAYDDMTDEERAKFLEKEWPEFGP